MVVKGRKYIIMAVLHLVTGWSMAQTNFVRDLSSNEFKPDGWVKEFLKRQEQGLGGISG